MRTMICENPNFYIREEEYYDGEKRLDQIIYNHDLDYEQLLQIILNLVENFSFGYVIHKLIVEFDIDDGITFDIDLYRKRNKVQIVLDELDCILLDFKKITYLAVEKGSHKPFVAVITRNKKE